MGQKKRGRPEASMTARSMLLTLSKLIMRERAAGGGPDLGKSRVKPTLMRRFDFKITVIFAPNHQTSRSAKRQRGGAIAGEEYEARKI